MPTEITQIRDRLTQGVVILDGATGTELERRGAFTATPHWSAAALRSAPDIVRAIHEDYVRSGADIVVANTFRTNPRALERAGCLEQGGELNRIAVDLARQAVGTVDRDVLVAASVAPVEDCYSPGAVPDTDALRREHAQMVQWLAADEPDLLWIETMNTIREAEVAAAAAREVHLPFAVSFVLAETGGLLSGDSLATAVGAVEPYEPLALGVNCIPPRAITGAVRALRPLTERPITAYGHISNAHAIPGWIYTQSLSPQEYASCALEWHALGATIIGGCCGTQPEHIRALSERLRGR